MLQDIHCVKKHYMQIDPNQETSGEGRHASYSGPRETIKSSVLQALHAFRRTHARALTAPDEGLPSDERGQPDAKSSSCRGILVRAVLISPRRSINRTKISLCSAVLHAAVNSAPSE